MAEPRVERGAFVYNLICFFEKNGNTHSQTSRCIVHLMPRAGCTVIFGLIIISHYSEFSTCYKTHTAGGLLTKTDLIFSDNLSHSLVQSSSFSQSRRDGGVFCAFQT